MTESKKQRNGKKEKKKHRKVRQNKKLRSTPEKECAKTCKPAKITETLAYLQMYVCMQLQTEAGLEVKEELGSVGCQNINGSRCKDL